MNGFVKILILMLLVAGYPLVSFSQAEKDKVEILRVSFINKKLDLTNAESEKFWPVYNEYNDKIKAIRKNLRQSYRRAPEPLSEAEAEELYLLDLKSKQAEVDVHKQYSDKIKNIIGVKKSVKLKVAEEEFKREIINSIKERSD
jgi:phage-related baseplate assembly protein